MPLLNQFDSLPPLKQKFHGWAAILKSQCRIQDLFHFFLSSLQDLLFWNLPVEMKYKGQSRKTVFYWKSFLWVIFCYRIFLVLALQFLPLLLRTEWSCEQKINRDCDMKLQFPICAKTLSCPHSSETDESLQRGKTNQCWKNLTILQKSNCKWSLRLPLYQQHSQIKFHPHFQSLRTPSGIFSADVTVPTVGWKLFKVLQTLILNPASSSLPINLHNKQ